MEIIFQRLYNAINTLLVNFTKVKIFTNNVNNPDEIESYFLELLDYNFPQTDDELISQEEENNINNEKEHKNKNKANNNNDIPLQKEFLDQYEVFKEMFYFLTHKEPKKVKTNNNSEINIINTNNVFPPLKEKEKNDSLFDNRTFSSKDSKKKDDKIKKIKNNSTNPKSKSNTNVYLYFFVSNFGKNGGFTLFFSRREIKLLKYKSK